MGEADSFKDQPISLRICVVIRQVDSEPALGLGVSRSGKTAPLERLRGIQISLSRKGRVFAVPLAGVLIMALAFAQRRFSFARSEQALWCPVALVTSLALAASAARDWRLTESWTQWRSELMAIAAERAKTSATPCPLLSWEESKRFGAFAVSHLTLLLQPAYPIWVAGVKGETAETEEEFCRWVAAGAVPLPSDHRGGYTPYLRLGEGKWIQVEPLRRLARARRPFNPTWKVESSSPEGFVTRIGLSNALIPGTSWRCQVTPTSDAARVMCRKGAQVVDQTIGCKHAIGSPLVALAEGSRIYKLSLWCLD